MRLFADESVQAVIVAVLRGAGHDIAWVGEDAPGTPDEGVLARARDMGFPLLTFDLDFGELIFRAGHPPPPGVVQVRLPEDWLWERMAARIIAVLADERNFSRSFVVIEEESVRVRPLPGEMA